MAWGSGPPKQDGEGGGPAAAGGQRGRFAAPPACPRCELTKSQMNRTIQNYQKAYRKKVEGLKQELATVRADNTHLRARVRRLRRRLHAPSCLLGGALGYLATRLVAHMQRRQRQQAEQQQPAEAPSDSELRPNGKASS